MWRVKDSVSHEDSIWQSMLVTFLGGVAYKIWNSWGGGEAQSLDRAATTLLAPDGWMNEYEALVEW